MKRNKLLSLVLIFTAIGQAFLFHSCARVDSNSNEINNNAIVRLYIGLSLNIDKKGIKIRDLENILVKHFDGATLQEASGFYKGQRERSLIITIINCCRWEQPEDQFLERIKHLADELRHELDQESILVEYTASGEIQIFEIME